MEIIRLKIFNDAMVMMISRQSLKFALDCLEFSHKVVHIRYRKVHGLKIDQVIRYDIETKLGEGSPKMMMVNLKSNFKRIKKAFIMLENTFLLTEFSLKNIK